VIASESHDGIPIVRLNRPDQRNAMIPAMLASLIEALERASTDGRPIILTGSGQHFCVGADLNWLASLADPGRGVDELVSLHHAAIAAMVDLPVPLITAVNGSVAGGGLGLALAGDYCLAAEVASFTCAYFRLGLTPDGGASALLERTIGALRTRELLLTNRRLSAREAHDWGLVNTVVAGDQLLDAAAAFAIGLAPVPAQTLQATRRLLDARDLRRQLDLEADAIRAAARGKFFQDAIAAFRRSRAAKAKERSA
jgi:2-(1,2-epoxy-1,2-dihydrophenyl)acetyl-CoA isomerase